jgi:uncharacterized protein YuzE
MKETVIKETDYDEDAGVLYLHFKKPNHADYSEMIEDEIIVRYENTEIIVSLF